MHILDSYALNCGAKVGKPYIYEQYYPLGEDKYITLQPYSRYLGKQYNYWPDVISYIHPHLEKEGIKIVQIGAKEDQPLPKSIWTQGTTSINQAAFLVKNSALHLGVDSFAVHIASGYGKKTVALYSTNWAKNSEPYWSREEDFVAIEPSREEKKPSFRFKDTGKQCINEIKPETIANHVLSQLDLNVKIPYNSIHFGESYTKTFIHIVPSSLAVLDRQIDFGVIRMDLNFNEEILQNQLQRMRSSIITSKPINQGLISQSAKNIQDIVYFLDESNDLDFIRFLHGSGINYVLVTELEGEKLNELKLKYLDYNFIFERTSPQKQREKILKSSVKNLFYKSNKKILKDGQYYSSVASLEKAKPDKNITDNPFNEVIDINSFWSDLDDFYIVEKLD